MDSAHVRPDFDLQSHSVHSDGALAPAEVVALAAAAGMRLMALTDHDTVDGVGRRCAPRASTACAARRPPSSPRRRATSRTCTCSATSCATTTRSCATRWPTSAPTAAGASGRWPTGWRSSASRSTAPRSTRARAGGLAARPPAPRRRGAAHPAQRGQAARGGHRRQERAVPAPTWSRARVAYVARSRPTVERGDRRHPRRRRRRGLGAPVLGRRRRRDGASPRSSASRAAGLDGVECFYATHTRSRRGCCTTPRASSGC